MSFCSKKVLQLAAIQVLKSKLNSMQIAEVEEEEEVEQKVLCFNSMQKWLYLIINVNVGHLTVFRFRIKWPFISRFDIWKGVRFECGWHDLWDFCVWKNYMQINRIEVVCVFRWIMRLYIMAKVNAAIAVSKAEKAHHHLHKILHIFNGTAGRIN